MNKKYSYLSLISLIVLSLFLFGSPASAKTKLTNLKIAGTVFYDENGNGWHDGNESTYISSGKSCKKSIKASGTKIKVRNKKTGKTNTYTLNICGGKSSGQYTGEGVYYETVGYTQGADLTFTLLPGRGWKSTQRSVVDYKVVGETYIDFAMAKI